MLSTYQFHMVIELTHDAFKSWPTEVVHKMKGLCPVGEMKLIEIFITHPNVVLPMCQLNKKNIMSKLYNRPQKLQTLWVWLFQVTKLADY